MLLLGLTGGMGQGKSTVGALLRRYARKAIDLEYSDILLAVLNRWLEVIPADDFKHGDPLTRARTWVKYLPPVFENATGIAAPYELIEPDPMDPEYGDSHDRLISYVDSVSQATKITRNNKAEHRYLFQWLAGISRAKLHHSTWSRAMDRCLDEKVDDQCYDLITIGGIRHPSEVSPIRRHNGLIIRVTVPEATWDNDATERQIRDLPHDIEVINDSTFEDLEQVTSDLWNDLYAGQPEPVYQASSRRV